MNISWKKVCLLLLVFIGVFLCAFFFVFNSRKSDNKDESHDSNIRKAIKGDVVWDGDSVVICDDKNIKVVLSLSAQDEKAISEDNINVELENKSKKTKSYDVNIKSINEKIQVDKNCDFYEIKSNVKQMKMIDYSDVMRMAEIKSVYCMDCEITDEENDRAVKKVKVAIKRMGNPKKRYIPFMGMYAEEQTIVSNDQIEMKIYNAGEKVDELSYNVGTEHYRGEITYSILNKVDNKLDFAIRAISVNGITIDASYTDRIFEKGKVYSTLSIEKDDLKMYGIKSINSLSVYLSYSNAAEDDVQYVDSKNNFGWYNVKLMKKGRESGSLEKNNQLVYEKDGVKISYTNTDNRYKDEGYHWNFNVVNKTDKNIYLKVNDSWTNVKNTSKYANLEELWIDSSCIGAKQKSCKEIRIDKNKYKNKKVPSVIKVEFLIIDNDTEEVLGKTVLKTIKLVKKGEDK